MLLLAPPVMAKTVAAGHNERTFAEAATAYDEDRLADAIAGWESLVQAGETWPEVLYNLGNAYYRSGNLGPAIRAYRHAQTLAPRDPDIRANLGFASQTAGITLPVRPPLIALLLQASRTEWRIAASAAYWLLALALGAWMLWPRGRSAARPTAILAACMLLLALAGLWAHHDLRQNPEWVVTYSGHKVRSGPLDTSTPLLSIPEGAIIRQVDRRGPWIEIQFETTRGWLPVAAARPVL